MHNDACTMRLVNFVLQVKAHESQYVCTQAPIIQTESRLINWDEVSFSFPLPAVM